MEEEEDKKVEEEKKEEEKEKNRRKRRRRRWYYYLMLLLNMLVGYTEQEADSLFLKISSSSPLAVALRRDSTLQRAAVTENGVVQRDSKASSKQEEVLLCQLLDAKGFGYYFLLYDSVTHLLLPTSPWWLCYVNALYAPVGKSLNAEVKL